MPAAKGNSDGDHHLYGKTIGCTGDTISSQVTVTVYEAPDMVMPENVEIKKGESST